MLLKCRLQHHNFVEIDAIVVLKSTLFINLFDKSFLTGQIHGRAGRVLGCRAPWEVSEEGRVRGKCAREGKVGGGGRGVAARSWFRAAR